MDLSFLKETHSCTSDEKQQADEFKGQMYFSHGKKNSSCGVVIAYCMSKPFTLVNQFSVGNSRVIVI